MSYKALYDILCSVKRHINARVIFRCDKVRKNKKQDKLLSTATQDVAHDVGPADHLHNSMWD